jgi:hypothetical protein
MYKKMMMKGAIAHDLFEASGGAEKLKECD